MNMDLIYHLQFEHQRENPISSYSFGKTAATHFLEMINKTENFLLYAKIIFSLWAWPKSRKIFATDN